jgi:hypothetical protein
VEWEVFFTGWRRQGMAFHRAINLPDFWIPGPLLNRPVIAVDRPATLAPRLKNEDSP